MKLSQEDKDIIISQINAKLNTKAIYLFGSFAKGVATKSSDVDIAYLSDSLIDNVARWNLAQDIAIALKKDVDLIDLKQAHTILRYQIISNGTRIFGSGDEIEMFESMVYTQYIQFQEQRADILQAKLDSFKGRLCQV